MSKKQTKTSSIQTLTAKINQAPTCLCAQRQYVKIKSGEKDRVMAAVRFAAITPRVIRPKCQQRSTMPMSQTIDAMDCTKSEKKHVN